MPHKWQDSISNFFLIHLCVKEIPTGIDRQLPEVWKAAKFGVLCPRVDLKIQIDFAWFHIPNMETQSLCCHKFVWLWLLHYVLEHYLGNCLLSVTRTLAGGAAVNWHRLLLSHIMLMKNYARIASNSRILIRYNFCLLVRALKCTVEKAN